MTAEDVTDAIASVADAEHTRWSIVFDRDNLTAIYYQNGDFSQPYIVHIK